MSRTSEHSCTALVIDDNRNRVSLVRRALRDAGVSRIVDVPDPASGADLCRTTWFDIAFTESVLPFADGHEFARMIRHDPQTLNLFLPIVLMASVVDRQTVVRAINAGIDAVLSRPLSQAMVAAKVRALLDRPMTYVKTNSGYFGPDRRRRPDPAFKSRDRRKIDEAIRLGPGAMIVERTVKRGPARVPAAVPEPLELNAGMMVLDI